ncbi:MAG TPA: phosphoadenosine phosphosulfate reductase family protein, partial [Solibacillus sp.]
MLTYENWSDTAMVFDETDELKGALQVLKWSYDTYGTDVVYACSFGIEGIVLIDLIAKVQPDAQIIFLDTNVHFKETYETIERVREKYPTLTIELKESALSLDEQAKQFGDKLWETEPNKCCQLRKLDPLNEVLSDALAWISGLRREQSETRQHVQFINQDHRFQSVKICPLIH